MDPRRTPIACPGIVTIKTLGTNYPCWRPGHPSPYLHLGSKPDLGPITTRLGSPYSNSPTLLFLPNPESVILVCTLDSFALTSPYP